MIRILNDHRCTKHHRSAATFLRCRQPDLEVVGTTGPLVLLIRCTETSRALLVRRLEQARSLVAEYDVFGCSPTCSRDHELVAVDLDPEPTALRAQRSTSTREDHR